VGECTVGPRRLGLEVQGFIKSERVHGGIKAFSPKAFSATGRAAERTVKS